MNRTFHFLCVILLIGSVTAAQTVIRLDDSDARQVNNSAKYATVDTTAVTVTIFQPDSAKATGTSVLLFPADGNLTKPEAHSETTALTKSLTNTGITVFLVDKEQASGNEKAVVYLRRHAADLHIQPNRIGVVGVDTGAGTAVRLAYQHTVSGRADFILLFWPRFVMPAGLSVPANAPPLFIVSGIDTGQSSVLPSTQFHQRWLEAGRSSELHSYAEGSLGSGGKKRATGTNRWANQLTGWLTTKGYLTPIAAPRSQPVPQAQPEPSATSVATMPTPESIKKSVVQPKSTAPSPAQQSISSSVKPSPATNQTVGFQVSGTVRDAATGQPLAGVTIVIDFRKALTGTTTNEQGQYSIELSPGQHILVARLVGYTPARKEIRLTGQPVTADIEMVSVASQLEEVVVTTKGFDQTIRQPILGVSQLNITALKKLPAALGEVDLLRALQMLPGVSSVGEASNGVNIRGGTTDQNLLLLDDTPIFNPTHMFGLFSVFPPDVLSTVDLYKGNVPARFGGRAASVLDVTLRNPSLDKFSLSGGVSVVSNKITADIPIVKGKFGLLVAGRGAFNDFLLPIVSDRLANIKAKFGDVVLKAFWRIDNRNTLTVTGYGSKDVFQTALLANLPNVNGTSTRYDHQTVNAMARWFRVLSPRLNLQTTAVYAHYVPLIRSSELSGNIVTLRQSLLQRQLKANLNYQLTNQKLEVGVTATHYQIKPGTLLPGESQSVNYVTTPTENALELGLYADYERSLGDKLAISVGLRYSQFLSLGPALIRQYAPGETRDDFSVIDSTRYSNGKIIKAYGGPEPRLGIRYSLGPNASFKFGYNLMRQYLQVVTNTTTPLPTSRWKTADTNIKPQISQLVTAGYFLTFKENIYEFTLESYLRTTENIVDYRPGADFLLQPYPETQLLQGRSRAYGVETMISKKKGELTGWLNYTYARTLNQVYEGPTIEQNVNSGNWYRANFDRPHTVNANMTIDVDRHNSFGFTFAYSTGRPYSAPTGFVTVNDSQYPYYGVRNNERLPDYHRLDFTWNIYNPSMKNRRWEGRWAFTLYNLYGHKNAYSVFFKTENGKTNAYKLQIFAAPIVSLAYNFVFK